MKQLNIHRSVVELMIATVGGLIHFNPANLQGDQYNVRLDDLDDGQIAVVETSEDGNSVVFVGMFNGEPQVLQQIETAETFRTFEFTGSAEFMELIETNGFIDSIDSLKLFFSAFEGGDRFVELIDSVELLGRVADEVYALPRGLVFEIPALGEEEETERVVGVVLHCLPTGLAEPRHTRSEAAQDAADAVSGVPANDDTVNVADSVTQPSVGVVIRNPLNPLLRAVGGAVGVLCVGILAVAVFEGLKGLGSQA